MELLLGKVTQQAMNYAIRSGITLTATYALKQSSKMLQNAPKTDASIELYELQRRLEHKIRIVSPAIDMIELIAARGNTSLESAVSLTKELRKDIERLSQRIGKAAAEQQAYRTGSSRSKSTGQAADEVEMQLISIDMKKLLTRIEDAVPLINLALTTSGAKLSTQLPSTVSPSRLLQASSFVIQGDTQYMQSPDRIASVGPSFTLSVYMLFAGNVRPETEEDIRETTWKEVIHKAKVKLRRVPLDVVLSTGSGSEALQSHQISTSRHTPLQTDSPEAVRGESRSDEFAYQLMIIEDLDDERVHDFDEVQPAPFDDVKLAGIREMIPIHEMSKIFYADTSKVLNIADDAESNRPVLLLRRDVQAVPPRRMVGGNADESEGVDGFDTTDDGTPKTEEDKKHVEEDHKDRQKDPWRLPASLDPEWIALEVYNEPEPTDSDDEDDGKDDFATPGEEPEDAQLAMSVSKLKVEDTGTPRSSVPSSQGRPVLSSSQQIKTSLSLLELLLRLTSLQQFQQQSHLSIPDELLNFFLEESASTGAGGNESHRQAIRADARRRVGWDPYDESPLKRRGEDYQYQSYYESPRVREQYQYSYEGSMSSPQAQQTQNQSSPGMQTRSITGTPESQIHRKPLTPMSSNHNKVTMTNRPEWLRKQDQQGRGSSPLRPSTVHSDEGIGTSPGSVPEPQP